MGTITSPSFPGSMVPVTRPTFPISSWSATIRPESFHQACGSASERFGLDPGGSEVGADAAVAPLQLLEHAGHGLGRGARDALAPLALGLVLRLVDPLLRPLGEVALGLGVVGGDLVEPDAREPQEQRDDEAGPVLAEDAMDDDGALGCLRDRGDGGAELRPATLEELEVDAARRRLRVRSRVVDGVDLLPLGVVLLGQERDVDDVDVELARRIGLELAVEPQVDDARNAVVEERGPAGVAQEPDTVGADHGAEARGAAVMRGVSAEVADVEAAVPAEGATGTSWAPRRVVEVAPSIRTSTSSPGCASPAKFTVVLRRVRPRRSDASVRLGPPASPRSLPPHPAPLPSGGPPR